MQKGCRWRNWLRMWKDHSSCRGRPGGPVSKSRSYGDWENAARRLLDGLVSARGSYGTMPERADTGVCPYKGNVKHYDTYLALYPTP